MKKEFDKWNEAKKTTEARPDNFGVHEREIGMVSVEDFETIKKRMVEFLKANENPLLKLHPGEPYFFIRAQDLLSFDTVA